MCTELLLATIYFITILIVNYFLYNLLKEYLKNIFYLSRLKTIFKQYKKEDVQSLALFYLFTKNEFKNTNLLSILHKFSQVNDILIIGTTYSFLANNIENKPRKSNALIYFLRLLENQYLNK